MGQITDTVEVRVFSNDADMNRAMQEKLEAIYTDILASAPLARAFEVYDVACRDVTRLKKAQASLTQRGADLFREMAEIRSRLETTTIESHAEGKHSLEISQDLRRLPTLESEHKLVSRVNSRIVEHLLPNAEIIETKKAADYFVAQAKSLREAALQRIQKTAQLMVEAAEHEGSIIFDSQNTLSGELRRHANEIEQKAISYRESAHYLETKQTRMTEELQSLNAIR
jgi:hypothetical protein